VLYGQIGEFGKTVADCTKVIELDPYYARYYSNRGAAYFELEELSKAITDSSKSIALCPHDASPHRNLALAYMKKGLLPKALASLDAAIKSIPDNPELLVLRGEILTKMGKPNEARDSRRKAERDRTTEPGRHRQPQGSTVLPAAGRALR
jgi:tetratricopeptide (TPR) repeat protein